MIRNRSLFTEIEKHLSQKQYSIITGARQVGKTSLLKLLFQHLNKAGKNVYYTSLEIPEILNAVNEHPEKILNFVDVKPDPFFEKEQSNSIYLLIDEIQYANDPTHFLKYLYDKYERNLKVIATGSSAFYMDREFKDSLAGRKRIFPLYPLSFEEFLSFKDEKSLLAEIKKLQKKSDYKSQRQEELNRNFFEYLNYGGYPAVVLEKDFEEKKHLLEELKNAYVKRDVLESGIAHENKFFLLLQILADQTGNLVNKQELGSTLSIDGKTIDNYLYVLQKCYHIHLIRPFFRNLRKELTKMPKVYFNDLGLRNVFLNRFAEVSTRSDKGALLENYFFLRFRQTYSLDQIRFWRTADRQEVDFVIEESFGQGKAHEIKWNPQNFKSTKYKKFVETYPNFPLTCLGVDDFL